MSTAPVTPPPQKSGGGNVLMIILIIGGVLLLVCGGICAGCIVVGGRVAKQTGDFAAGIIELGSVMDQTMQAVLNDGQVKAKLGEPLEPASVPMREGSGEIDPVHEAVRFDVKGPNGTAKATGHATKVEGIWKITQITVETSDGEKIEVTPPADSGMELNFGDVPEPPGVPGVPGANEK